MSARDIVECSSRDIVRLAFPDERIVFEKILDLSAVVVSLVAQGTASLVSSFICHQQLIRKGYQKPDAEWSLTQRCHRISCPPRELHGRPGPARPRLEAWDLRTAQSINDPRREQSSAFTCHYHKLATMLVTEAMHPLSCQDMGCQLGNVLPLISNDREDGYG